MQTQKKQNKKQLVKQIQYPTEEKTVNEDINKQ